MLGVKILIRRTISTSDPMGISATPSNSVSATTRFASALTMIPNGLVVKFGCVHFFASHLRRAIMSWLTSAKNLPFTVVVVGFRHEINSSSAD